jgi:uncharacterized protein
MRASSHRLLRCAPDTLPLPMTEPVFDYPRILQRALRSVVREVLVHTAAEGLPGEHHFYISVRTDHPEARVPAFLRERYPQEITIVIQHQFWDLVVEDAGFAVTLRFDGQQARLEVPFTAVVAFFDPAAQFGLRFDLVGLGGATPITSGPEPDATGRPDSNGGAAGGPAADADAPAGGEGKVLSFGRPRERREQGEE